MGKQAITSSGTVLISRKPIVTSHFPSHPQSYPSVCIDAFNHASQKHINDPSTSTRGSLDPVIWVNTLNRTGMGVGMGGAGICHIQREGLRFLVPVGQEGGSLLYV
jgi:AP-3 complex subunit mu